MIIMSNYSNPYQKICIADGKLKILKFENYNGEYDQGVAAQINNNTIMGLFTQNDNIYLFNNNSILNITNKNISCKNVRNDDIREFELKIDNNIVYKLKYDALCTIDDLMAGELEEEIDFLLQLTNILSSKESINNFVKGHSFKK